MIQVVVKRKRLIDLTNAAPKAAPVKPTPPQKSVPKPKQAEPKPLFIRSAPPGPPITAALAADHRNLVEPVKRPLTDAQLETLERIVQKAGEGHPKTLGLRLVLAASEELAASWPIGLLAKAFHLSGRPEAGKAVTGVALGCRTARFKDMADTALPILEQKLEQKATVPS